MARKSTHPNRQLFDYLNGSLNEQISQSIERHLAICIECQTVASIIRALKSQAAARALESSENHPDVSELAAFFYNEREDARAAKTAAHVAICRSCAEEIALYARAEHQAAHYDPTRQAEDAEMNRSISASGNRAAWEMIEDWEDTVYARTKPEIKSLSEDMMQKLASLLEERKDQLIEIERRAVARPEIEADDLVPVIVVSESGEFRSMEMFESAVGPQGHSTLRHTEETGRFDDKPFYALLDFGEEKPAVRSYLIRHGAVRLERASRPSAVLPRASYFIVES